MEIAWKSSGGVYFRDPWMVYNGWCEYTISWIRNGLKNHTVENRFNGVDVLVSLDDNR